MKPHIYLHYYPRLGLSFWRVRGAAHYTSKNYWMYREAHLFVSKLNEKPYACDSGDPDSPLDVTYV